MNSKMNNSTFSDKLKLVLKVLVVSRTGLASKLNVDKSLVGRWAAGTVTPSEHNLANITRFVANKVPGFTLLNWEHDFTRFAASLGIERPPQEPSADNEDMAKWVPESILKDAMHSSERRGSAYDGIWRSTRASLDMPGRFIHDICLIQRQANGMIRFKVGVEGVRYEGHSLLLLHQLFSTSYDIESGTVMFSIFYGVAHQRPERMDGITLATLRDAGGSPAASASVMDRIAELTGDFEKDDTTFEKAVADINPLAPEGSISPEIAAHLTQDVQSEVPGIARLLYGQSIARGSTLNGLE